MLKWERLKWHSAVFSHFLSDVAFCKNYIYISTLKLQHSAFPNRKTGNTVLKTAEQLGLEWKHF